MADVAGLRVVGLSFLSRIGPLPTLHVRLAVAYSLMTGVKPTDWGRLQDLSRPGRHKELSDLCLREPSARLERAPTSLRGAGCRNADASNPVTRFV